MKELFTRRSIRRYEDREVESEKIEKMLRAAMQAPSACDQRPWEFYVIRDKELLQKLAKVGKWTGPAGRGPFAFVVCTRTEGLEVPEYAEIDASIACQNILIEAEYLGLGACWMGIAPDKERMERVEEILAMPTSLRAFAIISCGYPAEHHAPADRYETCRVHEL